MKTKILGGIGVGVALLVNSVNCPAIADQSPSTSGEWSLKSEATPKRDDARASRRTMQDVIENAKHHSYVADSRKYRTGQVIPQFVAPTDQLEECAGTIIGNPTSGYLKDRYHFCSNWSAKLDHKTQGGIVDGGYTFDVVFIGTAYQNTRQINYEVKVDKILPWGNVSDNPNPTISFRIDCYAITGAYGCGSDGIFRAYKRVSEWSISSRAQMSIESSENNGVGPDKVNFLGWKLWMNAPDLAGADFEQLQVSQTARFDSAPYIPNYPEGSVFPEVMPHLLYKTSDPEVKKTAQHIKDACENPAITVPTVPNKDIPGCKTDNVEKPPLYRLYYDQQRRNLNRSFSVRTCAARWPNYPTQGNDCDEFPFAATYEGSAISEYEPLAPVGMFSVRALDSKDNQMAGNRLGTWYSADRILDGRLPILGAVSYYEPFKVWIQ